MCSKIYLVSVLQKAVQSCRTCGKINFLQHQCLAQNSAVHHLDFFFLFLFSLTDLLLLLYLAAGLQIILVDPTSTVETLVWREKNKSLMLLKEAACNTHFFIPFYLCALWLEPDFHYKAGCSDLRISTGFRQTQWDSSLGNSLSSITWSSVCFWREMTKPHLTSMFAVLCTKR